MVRVEAVLDSWKAVRKDASQAVLDMPAGQLDFRPTADLMTFREIALHILWAGQALAGMLADGVGDFQANRELMKNYFEGVPEGAAAEEIARRMNDGLERDCARLGGLAAAFWPEMITRLDGQPATRLEMLQFSKEHELTHRAQLFLYLRLNGVVPPTTRRRMKKP